MTSRSQRLCLPAHIALFYAQVGSHWLTAHEASESSRAIVSRSEDSFHIYQLIYCIKGISESKPTSSFVSLSLLTILCSGESKVRDTAPICFLTGVGIQA